MSLIDRQSSPGLRSTTAALFQIKMSVCIVSLPVTKGPPQHTNRCFWKVLLGYRPAWRWNPFLYCFSCSCTARTLCPTYCACCAVLQCVWPLVSINFPCVSASFWMFSRTINAMQNKCCLCRAKLAYHADSLLWFSVIRLHFSGECWDLNPAVTPPSLRQLTPRAVHKDSIVSAACSITL